MSVASKNLYELLGNDPPEDDQPTKAPREVVKNVTSSKKRDEKPAAAAAAPAPRGNGGRSGRGGRYTGNDAAFHDRDAGRDHNRSKGTDVEGTGSYPRGGAGRGRGGPRRGRDFDRHSATGKDEHPKQVAHGWGAIKGESELNDEIAGVELAQKDAVGANPADPNAAAPDAADADAAAAAAEEEVQTKTYDEYLAELAAKKANLGGPAEIRRPNEGTREDKKWANAKPLDKSGEEQEYFAGESRDKTRNRERKTKQLLDIEPRFVEPRGERSDRRGGAERGRGNRGGRGGERGGRGERGERGERGDRGAPRGDRAAAPRPARTPAAAATNVNINDASSFPALGA